MISRLDLPRYRFYLGIILLATLTLYSCWKSVQYYDIGILTHQYEMFNNFSNDNVSRVERKLSCLKGELPPNEMVGFVSSLEGRDRRSIFRWTQYALVPINVADSDEPDMLIAYFPDQDNMRNARIDGYSIQIDCKNGVGLFTKAGKN